MANKERHEITGKQLLLSISAFYSYKVFPRKQRNWRFIYLVSIKMKKALSASVAEEPIFSH